MDVAGVGLMPSKVKWWLVTKVDDNLLDTRLAFRKLKHTSHSDHPPQPGAIDKHWSMTERSSRAFKPEFGPKRLPVRVRGSELVAPKGQKGIDSNRF